MNILPGFKNFPWWGK